MNIKIKDNMAISTGGMGEELKTGRSWEERKFHLAPLVGSEIV
jgi:hypothetical protein